MACSALSFRTSRLILGRTDAKLTLVECADRHRRCAIPADRHTNAERLTADLAVLDVLLDFTARLIYADINSLPTIRAEDLYRIS